MKTHPGVNLTKYLLLIVLLFSCVHIEEKPEQITNSEWAKLQPYVIYISIDGYRADYTDLFRPANILKLRASGASSESLIPIYPSKTFASHYSMITGLTADHTGIVANEFYDPKRKQSFSSGSENAKSDGSWYFGHTLWEVAAAKKMLSASYYWVGSEVKIHQTQPTYWFRYDDSVSNSKRVQQVLAWLKLSPEVRPHLINLYFSNVDHAGHFSGSVSNEVKSEVLKIDEVIGELMTGVSELRSSGMPINIVLVSDHGMDDVKAEVEYIDDEADISAFIVSGHGPEMKLYLKENQERALILKTKLALAKSAKHFKIYMRDEIPENLHYRDSERIGDLVLVVDEPYLVETHSLFQLKSTRGNHGWDARKYEKMRGIFYAEGPAFKVDTKISSFENYNVYSVITHLLSLDDLAPVDSSLGERAKIFR